MAEVLIEHGFHNINPVNPAEPENSWEIECACLSAPIEAPSYLEAEAALAAHQSDMLTAAGFGHIETAKANAHRIKSLRGELKTLSKNLDWWSSDGHSTVTIRFLRQWITRANAAATKKTQ